MAAGCGAEHDGAIGPWTVDRSTDGDATLGEGDIDLVDERIGYHAAASQPRYPVDA
jgi:hypothetical protein